MKHSILTCAFLIMSATPTWSGEAADIAVAERLLKATELGAESAGAAMDRANAALLAVMSRSPDTEVMRGFRGTLEHCFREKCKDDRFWGPDYPEYYKSDEVLESEGCYSRTKANAEGCGDLGIRACKEPLPENVGQAALADYSMLACLMDNPRAKSIRNSLYDLFFDEEVEKRLEGVAPTEREAIKSQIGATDI